ncbi:hypothetical protein LOK49_LG02G02203 [Camellia lanceoleosa]|uniref:Uncharacterized protein n=1 Tax=Camellia lanceoleosa TaxID=1840588 RepID=A0ACC0ISX8_9ERIC|nr:hypothetical protein LOK49_LG02G02203 [Camellia lanceoleosa]
MVRVFKVKPNADLSLVVKLEDEMLKPIISALFKVSCKEDVIGSLEEMLEKGIILIVWCLYCGMICLAVNILESYPKLADKRDEKGIPSMVTDSEIVGDVEDPRGSAHDISKSEGTLLSKLMSVFPWIKRIDGARQKHVFARELAKRLKEEENGWSDYLNCENFHVSGLGCFGETSSQNKKNRVVDPLILATKHGIHEMVEEILEKFPNVATTFDENGSNILHMAAQLKDRILYDYLKKTVNHADRMMADVDKHGNTILHLLTYECKQGHFLATHFGPINRMSWDVFWFKGKTPKELFEEEHKDVINKAEKVAKDINRCLMLVSTLIGTVNYAALFTIPGGFDQDKGLPIFFTKAKNGREDLQLFMVYVGGSLVASLLGLGTQLSIQVSRFNSNDF